MRRLLLTNNRKEIGIEIERFFCYFFQNIKNWSDIKSRGSREESRPLTNTNISSKERRSEIIPNILSLFVN